MASGLCAALTGRTHGCTDQPANVKKTLANSAVHTWHLSSFRCGANVWTLLEVNRTSRARRERVDSARLAHRRRGYPKRGPCSQRSRSNVMVPTAFWPGRTALTISGVRSISLLPSIRKNRV
jgi:hypothetical protein